MVNNSKIIDSFNLIVFTIKTPSFKVTGSWFPKSSNMQSFCCIIFVLSRHAGQSVLEELIQQIVVEGEMWVLRLGQLDSWGGFGLGRVARQKTGRCEK